MQPLWTTSPAQGTLWTCSAEAPQGLQQFTFTAGDLSTADLTGAGDDCLRVLMTVEIPDGLEWRSVKTLAWCSCEHSGAPSVAVPQMVWTGYAPAVRLRFEIDRKSNGKVNAISWSVVSVPSLGPADPLPSLNRNGPSSLDLSLVETLLQKLVTAARA